MTITETKKIISIMVFTYPNFKPANVAQTIEIWANMLVDYPYQVIEAALKAYIMTDTSGFAPSISQLIALTRKFDGDAMEAGEAWALVRRAISKGTYYSEEEYAKLPPDVQRAVGSARQLYVWATDEDYNESVISSNFKKNYNIVLERSRQEALIPQNVMNVLKGDKRYDIEGSNTGILEDKASNI